MHESLTCRRRCTNWRMTLGSSARSAAPPPPLVGRAGRLPSSGWLTVVKQMLYSWMMEGYRLLKSSSSTNLSYNPFLGSSTRPPAYCGAPRFLPPPAGTDASYYQSRWAQQTQQTRRLCAVVEVHTDCALQHRCLDVLHLYCISSLTQAG